MNLKHILGESQKQVEAASSFLENTPGVDISILASLPEIDGFISQINEFITDILDYIIELIDGIKSGLEFLEPELRKFRVMFGSLVMIANTFKGLMGASASITTTSGNEVMSFSSHADFTERIGEVTDKVSDLFEKVIPDHELITSLKSNLDTIHVQLVTLRSNLAL